MKKYILFAGVNGAGKSTLYQVLGQVSGLQRINTDELIKSYGDWKNPSDVMKAGKFAVKKIKEYFKYGISFNQETTLCGNSIIKNIILAKQLGYRIELHYIGLGSVNIAKERIAYRVAHGGHGIPDKDVERRFKESGKNLKKVLPLCDLVIMYDNTERFRRFAVYENGILIDISGNVPGWYRELGI